jgi:hypothetical protein
MIKTLSPYYITVPFVNPDTEVVCDSYTINIYIWNGAKNAVPSTPEYSKTIINASASNGSSKIEIAKLVNDFIDFDCVNPGVTSLENGNNQVWVKTEIVYNDQPTVTHDEQINMALKGYGYFLDGENSQIPSNKILIYGDEFKVNRNGFICLPIVMNEGDVPLPSFMLNSVTSMGSGIYEYNATLVDFDGNLSLFYRQQGDTVWITSKRYYDYTDGTYDFLSNTISLTGNVEFVVGLFYPEIGEHIYSNIITLSI